MSWRTVPFVKVAALVGAAFLLLVPSVLAGPGVPGVQRSITRPKAASVRVVSSSARPAPLVTLAVAVASPNQPAAEPVYVGIRGPDGQLRRFPVEGGRAAIQYRQVVLHPGDSLTIQWTAPK